jgi:hypothetical protein
MSQTRAVFEVTELLHLELKCPDCHAVVILPITPLGDPRAQVGQTVLMYCPWCNSTNIAQHATDVRCLLSSLLLLKDSNAPLVRFVFQDNVRDKE